MEMTRQAGENHHGGASGKDARATGAQTCGKRGALLGAGARPEPEAARSGGGGRRRGADGPCGRFRHGALHSAPAAHFARPARHGDA